MSCNSKLNNRLEQLFLIYENNCTVESKQKFWICYDRILSIQRILDFRKRCRIPSDSDADLESVTSLVICGSNVTNKYEDELWCTLSQSFVRPGDLELDLWSQNGTACCICHREPVWNIWSCCNFCLWIGIEKHRTHRQRQKQTNT